MAAWGSAGRQAQPVPPAFEAVSIKPSSPGEGGSGGYGMLSSGRRNGSRWVANGFTVRSILYDAYELAPTQYAGGPDWLGNARFDFEAVTPPGTSDTQFRLMLQTMLTDRFQLATHRETRQLPAYTLAVAKEGSRLKPSQGQCGHAGQLGMGVTAEDLTPCGPEGFAPGAPKGRMRLVFRNISTAELVEYLRPHYDPDGLGYPLLDETGLQGRFDIDLQCDLAMSQAPPVADGAVRGAVSAGDVVSTRRAQLIILQKAFHDQLGLDLNMLKPAIRAVPVLVIDKLSMPTPN